MNSGVTELFNINSFLLDIESGKSILKLTIKYSFQKLQLNITFSRYYENTKIHVSTAVNEKGSYTWKETRENLEKPVTISSRIRSSESITYTLKGEIYEINKSKKE